MKRRKGFTLIELLVVVAIIALLISILLPSLSRARELSKRLVCGANTKGIGTSCKIYANENEESWPIPNFKSATAQVKTWVTGSPPTGLPPAAGYPATGTEEQPTVTQISTSNTTTLSTTRAFWMLVRTGDNTPKQYICPSSGDTQSSSQEQVGIDKFYDFYKLDAISYGYQVPYGPNDTRPGESLDPRMVVAADKGPIFAGGQSDFSQIIADWEFSSSPDDWKPFNSPNHGGRGAGEGENCLFADGHSSFERKPTAGIDQDNIYTLMDAGADIWLDRAKGKGNTIGGTNAWYPGQNVFSTTAYASTDTLIFP